MNSELEIIRLQESQIGQASATLINAFENNPKAQGDDEGKEDLFLSLFSPLVSIDYEEKHSNIQSFLRYFQSLKHVYTTPEVKGVAVWIPPLGYPLDIGRCLETGYYWGITQSCPFSFLTDLFSSHNLKQPYWYLSALGVLQDYQRQGIGSSLIQPILRRASEDGLPCYLFAKTEEALSFYQQNGFEILEEFKTNPQANISWIMKRDPEN